MRHIPLLAEEGRLRHQENAAKPQRRRRRARSASAIARSRNSGQSGWPSKGCRTDHPVRDKSERFHFLMSRTPLLCEEGNVRPENFVQKTKSCNLVTHRGIAATKENLPQRRRELGDFVCSKNGTLRNGVGCFFKSKDDSLDTFSKQRSMKVDKQAELPSAKLQVAEQLSLMNG